MKLINKRTEDSALGVSEVISVISTFTPFLLIFKNSHLPITETHLQDKL